MTVLHSARIKCKKALGNDHLTIGSCFFMQHEAKAGFFKSGLPESSLYCPVPPLKNKGSVQPALLKLVRSLLFQWSKSPSGCPHTSAVQFPACSDRFGTLAWQSSPSNPPPRLRIPSQTRMFSSLGHRLCGSAAIRSSHREARQERLYNKVVPVCHR